VVERPGEREQEGKKEKEGERDREREERGREGRDGKRKWGEEKQRTETEKGSEVGMAFRENPRLSFYALLLFLRFAGFLSTLCCLGLTRQPR
jgi:hypothetical protein